MKKTYLGKITKLCLMVGAGVLIIAATSGKVSAVATSLNYSSAITTSAAGLLGGTDGGGGTTTATGGNQTINAFTLALPSVAGCTDAEVESLSVLGTYSKTAGLVSGSDGAIVVLFDTGTSSVWGTLSSIEGVELAPGFAYRDYTNGGGTLASTGDLIGGTWSSGAAVVGTLAIIVKTDANDSGVGESVSTTVPAVDVTYGAGSVCLLSNAAPTIASAFSIHIPQTTALGSTVVAGTTLAASDGDTDPLTYSITSGSGGYFSINSTNGDIATTQANVPVGTYVIAVLVDDGNGGQASTTVTIVVDAGTSEYGGSGDIGLANTGASQVIYAMSAIVLLATAALTLRRNSAR